MPSADLILLASWALFALISCVLTLHLQKDLGVIVASQAFTMTLAALVFGSVVRDGNSTGVAIGAAAAFGAALGLIHVPLLRLLGPELLLVVSAITHIVLTQFWLALPEWTGGSGGLLVSSSPSWLSPALLFIALAIAFAYRAALLGVPHSRLSFAAIRSIGEQAGALGIPVLVYYRFSFALYGMLLGLSGAEAVRVTGFVVFEMFGLSWALTIVLITLVASIRASPLPILIVLAISFALIKVGLRQIWNADPQWSHAYDILVPTLLLLVYLLHRFGQGTQTVIERLRART